MRRFLAMAGLVLLIAVVSGAPPTHAVNCSLTLSLDPATVNLPYALGAPQTGPLFGEIVDANYTTDISGQTVRIQYLNGSAWLGIQNFSANAVGFTETSVSLTSNWSKLGLNSLRGMAGPCVSPPATFTVQLDSTAVAFDLAAYAVLAMSVISFYLVARRAHFFSLLVIAGALYFFVSPFTGQRYDIFFLLSSGIRILQGVNPFAPGVPPVYPGPLKWAYPPLYALYSALSFSAYQSLTGAQLPTVVSLTWPGWLTSTYNVWLAFVPQNLPVLVALLKLPTIVSGLATAVLLMRMTGSRSAPVFWLVNPLVILLTAIWGVLDPIATFLAVASLYYYERGKPLNAYLLASLGAAVKIWPVLLIPIFLASSLRKDGWKASKALIAVLPALAVTIGLYAAYGNLAQSLSVFVYARGIPVYAGQFSVNGLTWQQVLFLLHSPPVPFFLIIGIPAYLFVLLRVYRAGEASVRKWIIISIMIFFLTYNYVNPQYFYWLLPFLVLQGRRVASWLFTALPMVWVALSYNIFYFVSPSILLHEFSLGASIAEQLKLVYFYTTPAPYLLVGAAVPTAAYLGLLLRELDAGVPARPEILRAMKGLVNRIRRAGPDIRDRPG